MQDCFLAYRGSGVMLSALDVELLAQWASLDLPFEVVARGIRRAAEAALFDARPGEPALRSLRACRKAVDAEIRKYLGRAAGRTSSAPVAAEPEISEPTGPAHERRHEKLRATLRKIARGQPSLAPAIARLLEGPVATPPSDLAEATTREEAVEVALLRALPFSERLSLLREARELTEKALLTSAWARQRSRRFHRSALLRRRLSLPSFW